MFLPHIALSAALFLSSGAEPTPKVIEVEQPPEEETAPKHRKEHAHFDGGGVQKLKGQIGAGGEATLTAKALTPGASYVFRLTGKCDKRTTNYRRRVHMNDPNGDIFGLDFRVQIDGGDPKPVEVGKHHAETAEVSFVAAKDTATIRVFDRSSEDAHVTCKVNGFEVAPK